MDEIAAVKADVQQRAERAALRAFRTARTRPGPPVSDPTPAKMDGRTPSPSTALAGAPFADPLQPLIARLTNWQRHQWARAGRPRSAVDLTAFALMKRPA